MSICFILEHSLEDFYNQVWRTFCSLLSYEHMLEWRLLQHSPNDQELTWGHHIFWNCYIFRSDPCGNVHTAMCSLPTNYTTSNEETFLQDLQEILRLNAEETFPLYYIQSDICSHTIVCYPSLNSYIYSHFCFHAGSREHVSRLVDRFFVTTTHMA